MRKSFNRSLVSAKVYWQFSTAFALELTSRQWTRSTENWVSAFCKSDHHRFSDSVPFSSWSLFISRRPLFLWHESEEWPTSCWTSFCEKRHKCGTSIVVVRPFCSWTFGLRGLAAMLWIREKYSTRIPSTHRQLCPKFLYCGESLNHPYCRSQTIYDVGFWFIFPRHNTESQNTWTFACERLMTSSSLTKDTCFHGELSQFIVLIP